MYVCVFVSVHTYVCVCVQWLIVVGNSLNSLMILASISYVVVQLCRFYQSVVLPT